MFSAPIPVPAAPRTRADARRSLVKRVALALTLFALVGLVYWREYLAARQPWLLDFPSVTTKEKQALTVRCPTCGAPPGTECVLTTGKSRTSPHRDRRVLATEE
jgi:hypothetical protein